MRWYYCPWAETFIAYLEQESYPSVPCKYHYFEHRLTEQVDDVMKLKCTACYTEQIVPEGEPCYFEEWEELGPAMRDEELSKDSVVFMHEGLCSVCAASPL